MKTKRVKRILAILICAVLAVTMLPASVFAANDTSDAPAATEQAPADSDKAAEDSKETDKASADAKSGEAAEPEKSGSEDAQGETPSKGAEDDTSSKEDDTDGEDPETTPPVQDEPPNTDIVVIPSDANALILMDVGAESPKGVPGDIVTIVLPMAVNKEYLPSERYMLRNINIAPAIPTDTSVSNWPFDIIDAASTRHLQDMTYNSTAEVYFDFRISQFAKKGVYPVNFKVNATVWRMDDVNGTTITEDVTFNLCVYVTITDDGNMSGVTTSFGCLQIAGTNLTGTQSISTAKPNQTITLKVPVVNVGGDLTNVTVNPVVSTNLDEFPFVVKSTNLSKSFDSWKSREIKYLEYTFTIADKVTSGNKVIRFNATYFENKTAAEGNFSTQITIVNGYTPPEQDTPTAMSVMVESYKIYVQGTEVSGLMAGEEAELVLTIKNNSTSDTARKVLTNLVFTNSPGLTLSPGSTDSAYIDSIRPGATQTARLKIMARPDAEAGYSMLGIGLTYEGAEHTMGSANQNIMIPVSQKMDIQVGTPSVYGKQVKGREGTISLQLTNMGRGKAMNIRIITSDGLQQSAPTYVGDIPAGGSSTADVAAVFTKIGAYIGTLVVQYEDANGQLYTATAQVQLNVEDPDSSGQNNNNSTDPNGGNGGGNGNGGSGGGGSGIGNWLPWVLLAVVVIAAAVVIIVVSKKKGKLPGTPS